MQAREKDEVEALSGHTTPVAKNPDAEMNMERWKTIIPF